MLEQLLHRYTKFCFYECHEMQMSNLEITQFTANYSGDVIFKLL